MGKPYLCIRPLYLGEPLNPELERIILGRAAHYFARIFEKVLQNRPETRRAELKPKINSEATGLSTVEYILYSDDRFIQVGEHQLHIQSRVGHGVFHSEFANLLGLKNPPLLDIDEPEPSQHYIYISSSLDGDEIRRYVPALEPVLADLNNLQFNRIELKLESGFGQLSAIRVNLYQDQFSINLGNIVTDMLCSVNMSVPVQKKVEEKIYKC